MLRVMFLLLQSCQSHAALMGLSLFSVISVFNMETSPAGDIVTFGSDYSLVRMRREQFLETVPRNNHNMVLLELSKGMLTFNKTQFIFPNIQTPLFRNPLEFEIKICFVESLCFSVDSVFSVNAHNQFTSRGGGRVGGGGARDEIVSMIVSVFSRTVKNRLLSRGLNLTVKHLSLQSASIPKVTDSPANIFCSDKNFPS